MPWYATHGSHRFFERTSDDDNASNNIYQFYICDKSWKVAKKTQEHYVTVVDTYFLLPLQKHVLQEPALGYPSLYYMVISFDDISVQVTIGPLGV